MATTIDLLLGGFVTLGIPLGSILYRTSREEVDKIVLTFALHPYFIYLVYAVLGIAQAFFVRIFPEATSLSIFAANLALSSLVVKDDKTKITITAALFFAMFLVTYAVATKLL